MYAKMQIVWGFVFNLVIGNGRQQIIRLINIYMRGKKVINSNQILQNNNLKVDRPIIKKRINEVKSLQAKVKIQPMVHQTQQIIRLPSQNIINDYEIQRQQHQKIPHKYSHQTNYNPILPPQTIQQISRFQRNTQGPTPAKARENYLVNGSLNRSHQGSQQKIQMIAIDSKQKSVSRSQNSSAKKRGIQLTKTLLKRISGMYNDKDFTNRTVIANKSQREQTTGMMTLSGRGVCDQYQISDFDIQMPNHTVNTSNSHQLSFNDSGHWKNSINCTNNSSSWNRQSAELTSSHHQNPKNNQPVLSNKYNQNIIPESSNYVSQSPKKELLKVRSYNLINTQTTAESVIVGGQPPQRPHLTRRGQMAAGQSKQRYLIRSKNKTMDQMSLKESMVVGNEHYYQ